MSADDILDETLSVLGRGGTILYPTDTIWGLGCDATCESAVREIYGLKQRPRDKSMIALVECESRLAQLVPQIPERARTLIRTYEKPLTIIYQDARHVAPSLLAADGSLGIRLTRDPWLKELIQRLNRPLVSTSANPSGAPTPMRFSQIHRQILEGVNYAVPLRRGEKARFEGSTIIKLGDDQQFEILRK